MYCKGSVIMNHGAQIKVNQLESFKHPTNIHNFIIKIINLYFFLNLLN